LRRKLQWLHLVSHGCGACSYQDLALKGAFSFEVSITWIASKFKGGSYELYPLAGAE
jgi:hypothetical protein